MNDSDAAFAAAFPDDPLSPAILAGDGRGAVTIPDETRDLAEGAAEGIAQLEAAEAGLVRVQQLVARLRDAAVVAVDRGLHPASRAALQRQVDLVLAEIDSVADETLLDERLLRDDAPVSTGDTAQLLLFRAIGTVTLGIAGLAVRSSDQAIAAAGALDVATTRLERAAGMLSAAAARLQGRCAG
jgi:flagellin-like hook-associated protein FlgL